MKPYVRNQLKAIFRMLDGRAIETGELTRRVYGEDTKANRMALCLALRAWKAYEGAQIEGAYFYRLRGPGVPT